MPTGNQPMHFSNIEHLPLTDTSAVFPSSEDQSPIDGQNCNVSLP